MGLLSTMLIEMSGFSLEHGWRARMRTWFYKTFLRRTPPKPEKRVMTIGATNRVQAMDAALLRPGRFDKKIRIDAPDMLGRQDIFDYYLSKISHESAMNSTILASDTPGYTPADIKYLLNEALRYALFQGRDYITYRDFQIAQPEHEHGLRAPLKHMSEEARRRLAYHEAGHAVSIRLLLPNYRISRITIIRQGQAFGYVQYYDAREAYQGMMTYETHTRMLKVAVAGKAAEIEFCGLQNQTLGVGGDFYVIRERLLAMAFAGMFGPLGAAMINTFIPMQNPELTDRMEETFQQVLYEMRLALRKNSHIVEALVERLMETPEMLSDEVKAFFDEFGLKTPVPTMLQDGEEIQLIKEVLDGIDEVAQPVAAGGK
jgi:cell division protease FtsH